MACPRGLIDTESIRDGSSSRDDKTGFQVGDLGFSIEPLEVFCGILLLP